MDRRSGDIIVLVILCFAYLVDMNFKLVKDGGDRLNLNNINYKIVTGFSDTRAATPKDETQKTKS